MGLLKVIATFLGRAFGLLDTTQGHPANTSVAYHAGDVMTLFESDFPYLMRLSADGAPSTLAHQDYGGKLNSAFTAHPKPDPASGKCRRCPCQNSRFETSHFIL